MTIHVAASAGTEARNAEERWARWVESGAEHERTIRRRATLAAIVIACGLVVWLTAAVAGG
jgi:hypothetical protein